MVKYSCQLCAKKFPNRTPKKMEPNQLETHCKDKHSLDGLYCDKKGCYIVYSKLDPVHIHRQQAQRLAEVEAVAEQLAAREFAEEEKEAAAREFAEEEKEAAVVPVGDEGQDNAV